MQLQEIQGDVGVINHRIKDTHGVGNSYSSIPETNNRRRGINQTGDVIDKITEDDYNEIDTMQRQIDYYNCINAHLRDSEKNMGEDLNIADNDSITNFVANTKSNIISENEGIVLGDNKENKIISSGKNSLIKRLRDRSANPPKIPVKQSNLSPIKIIEVNTNVFNEDLTDSTTNSSIINKFSNSLYEKQNLKKMDIEKPIITPEPHHSSNTNILNLIPKTSTSVTDKPSGEPTCPKSMLQKHRDKMKDRHSVDKIKKLESGELQPTKLTSSNIENDINDLIGVNNDNDFTSTQVSNVS